MNWFQQAFEAQLTISGHAITSREIVGNLFGLASAIGGMRRKVWAWPVGIVGNVLLFTVFLGVAFGSPQGATLYGQAARQIFFILASVYGWVPLAAGQPGDTPPAVAPPGTRAGRRPGSGDLPAVAAGWSEWSSCNRPSWPCRALGGTFFPPRGGTTWPTPGSSSGPSLATYAMARGWNEFWLGWIAVDLVGVPELLHFRFYPSAVMYGVYGAFVIWGFFVGEAAGVAREEGAAARPGGPGRRGGDLAPVACPA